MPTLPLAVEIADTVTLIRRRRTRIDIELKADQLLREHPEAEATRAHVVETLRAELADFRCGVADR